MPEDGTGAQPARRPRPSPRRAVAVAGLRRPARRDRCSRRVQRACPSHHLRARHTGCDQIASQQSSKPSAPASGPRWPKKAARTPGIPSVMRPCHGWTQRDTAGPDPPPRSGLHACDLRNYRPMRPVPWIAAPDSRSRAPVLHEPLTSPDLAHHWPTAPGTVCRTAPGHASDPASGNTGTGSDLGF
jgi:hypothetical protein